jgi:hypothetical protein
MGTRSIIAIQDNKTECLAVYCHYDGYPTNQMPILNKKYNRPVAIRKLLSGGDMSSLQTETTWTLGESREAQPLYYRERGDKDIDMSRIKIDDLAKHADACCAEYIYLYRGARGWSYWKTERLLRLIEHSPQNTGG